MALLSPNAIRYRRLLSAFGFFVVVVLSGTIAFHAVGEGLWTWFDCLYMTVITLSTVGFSEVLPGMNSIPEARLVTILMIVFGTGTVLYFISSLTALIVDTDFRGMLKGRRMQQRIKELKDHVIVCGAGTTGRHIVEELIASAIPFVVVEQHAERIEELSDELSAQFLYLIGDATDDLVLERAGLKNARGIISALNDDKSNLFVTVSARDLNTQARIIAKAVEPSTESKLRRAGANAVVSPNYIGGLRLASEMLRPHTVALIDRMIRYRGDDRVRMETLHIPDDSPLVECALGESGLTDTGALFIAIQLPEGNYIYKPDASTQVPAKGALVALGDETEISRVRSVLQGGA